jgi:hypothetical protein
MKKQRIMLCIITVLAILFTALPHNARIARGAEPHNFVPGEVVVGLQDTSVSSIKAIETMGGTIVRQITVLNAMVIQVAAGKEQEFIHDAKSLPGFKYAEQNGRADAVYTPNDQYWSSLWNMRIIKADQAWDTYRGFTDIVVAIVDTGVDYNHQDLSAHYVAGGYDWVNDDSDPMDDNGHGTHCAGIAAAVMDNSFGVVGVSQCSIWAEKVLPASGTGGTWDDLASGITHAADNDVDIISMSMGGTEYSNLVNDACTYAWNRGVLLVAASGNNKLNLDVTPFYPACYSSVIAVSATNSTDQRWWEQSPSIYGSNYGSKIELAAPGESIYSTIPGDNYGYKTGTSMACPHVAGLAALLWSYKPTLANSELRNKLHDAVDDLGTSGKDIYYGYGRINAAKVITIPGLENPATFKTTGATPAKLAIYLGPPSVPARIYSHYCIFVQLQDASGNPAYAPSGGVGISLKSSNTTVGTVSTSTTISAGGTFVRTYFTAKATTGTTLIAASSSDYAPATATLKTVVPSNYTSGTKTVVYTMPPKLPADSSYEYYSVIVELQDAQGNPAVARPSGVTAGLSSNNTKVGTPSSSATIPADYTFAQAAFYSTYAPGSANITAAAPGFTSGSAIMTTVAPVPIKLAVYAAPPTVLADSGSYYNVFVQLQDAAGNPARAPASVQVALSSTNPTIGTVSSTITIPTGYTYSTTYFESTYTPGTTVITAFAVGYLGSSAIIKTTAPKPTKLAVYSGPSLPADNSWHYTAVVQLQDAAGTPAKAPVGGVTVVLTSSNPLVGTVGSPLTISAGYCYTHISFKTTFTAGSTTITAMAAGYGTSSSTVTTVVPSGNALKLAVYSVPPKLCAESRTYYYPIVVQLQDAANKPAKAPVGGVTVSLSSTNPSVGTVYSLVTIAQDDTYARTTFFATFTPGTTSVKVVASGYSSGSGSVTTTGAIPARLGLYAALSKVPADSGSYSIVVVQLQDADGNPARAPSGGCGISLWSSNLQVGTVTIQTSLGSGSTHTITTLYSTYTPGSTSIGASTFMLLSTLSLSITPKTVSVGGQLTIGGQLWPQISTTLYLYYRSGSSTWSLATTITTKSDGSYSIAATIPSMPKGTYDLVAVWLGSKTYKGAVSEIRSFTVV